MFQITYIAAIYLREIIRPSKLTYWNKRAQHLTKDSADYNKNWIETIVKVIQNLGFFFFELKIEQIGKINSENCELKEKNYKSLYLEKCNVTLCCFAPHSLSFDLFI